MKRKYSGHFDEVCKILNTTDKSFRLGEMATLMKTTPQKIRRLRAGTSILNVAELDVLMKHYYVNPTYLVTGQPPMMLMGENAVAEPRAEYQKQSALKKENEELKQRLEEKDKMIALLEKLNKKK